MKNLAETLAHLGVTQAELAKALGVTQAAVSYKLAGHRPWRVDEANTVLNFLKDYDAELTLDYLFAQPLTQDALEASSHV